MTSGLFSAKSGGGKFGKQRRKSDHATYDLSRAETDDLSMSQLLSARQRSRSTDDMLRSTDDTYDLTYDIAYDLTYDFMPTEVGDDVTSHGFFSAAKKQRKKSDTSKYVAMPEEPGSGWRFLNKFRRWSDTSHPLAAVKTGKSDNGRKSAIELIRIAKRELQLNFRRLSSQEKLPPMPPARDFLLEDVDELPPPIPERKCSLDGLLDVDEDFQNKFIFRKLCTVPLPEAFTNCKKTYPSRTPRKNAVQRPGTPPPPPPPPPNVPSPTSPTIDFLEGAETFTEDLPSPPPFLLEKDNIPARKDYAGDKKNTGEYYEDDKMSIEEDYEDIGPACFTPSGSSGKGSCSYEDITPQDFSDPPSTSTFPPLLSLPSLEPLPQQPKKPLPMPPKSVRTKSSLSTSMSNGDGSIADSLKTLVNDLAIPCDELDGSVESDSRETYKCAAHRSPSENNNRTGASPKPTLTTNDKDKMTPELLLKPKVFKEKSVKPETKRLARDSVSSFIGDADSKMSQNSSAVDGKEMETNANHVTVKTSRDVKPPRPVKPVGIQGTAIIPEPPPPPPPHPPPSPPSLEDRISLDHNQQLKENSSQQSPATNLKENNEQYNEHDSPTLLPKILKPLLPPRSYSAPLLESPSSKAMIELALLPPPPLPPTSPSREKVSTTKASTASQKKSSSSPPPLPPTKAPSLPPKNSPKLLKTQPKPSPLAKTTNETSVSKVKRKEAFSYRTATQSNEKRANPNSRRPLPSLPAEEYEESQESKQEVAKSNSWGGREEFDPREEEDREVYHVVNTSQH